MRLFELFTKYCLKIQQNIFNKQGEKQNKRHVVITQFLNIKYGYFENLRRTDVKIIHENNKKTTRSFSPFLKIRIVKFIN